MSLVKLKLGKGIYSKSRSYVQADVFNRYMKVIRCEDDGTVSLEHELQKDF